MMSFRSFWPLYVRAHRSRATRAAHYCATAMALSTVAISVVFADLSILLIGIAVGYAVALTSHRLGDGSRSLVMVNPVWGALADLKMCWLAVTGGLRGELDRHGGEELRQVQSTSGEQLAN